MKTKQRPQTRSSTVGCKLKPPILSWGAWPALLLLALSLLSPTRSMGTALVGWNNLGMHCMDRDFSVFSILPPYNTIEAQLVVNGQLVETGTGYTVTYQAIADPTGSINTTSAGKGNFYNFTQWLYGPLNPDAGLVGWSMPGAYNTPQSMRFETMNSPAAGVSTPVNWFRAEGIPITPYDDAGKKNAYPLMRLTARDSANAVVATTDIVLPVSDEMDCRACHASGSGPDARPFAGWVNSPDPERDYRLNIVKLHDDVEFAAHSAEYTAALAARGFNAAGLYANVVTDGKPILCASCHASEALGAPSYGSIPALTTSIHGYHAHVKDPILNTTLDDSANRASCYRCHPGSETKCLRGAMGSAVAADGSMEMQCQSCHGTLSQVGSPSRVGWFMEPNCQSCHTGTASHNNGQIRYTSVFTDANGTVRTPVDQTFATTPNTPAAGLSLYRFSVGHGGLQCSACHGSTHAEFPSSHANDNIASTEIQGHKGVIGECTACHTTAPTTANGGPHGMHPVGSTWISNHHDMINGNLAACQACHGTDYRGTVLSRTFGDRTFSTFGTQKFFRGAIIGCYTCHKGPSDSNANTNAAPTVTSVSASTAAGTPVAITLPYTGTGVTLRIISQAGNGTVGLSGNVATYYPDAGFSGNDAFTFAAYDGSKNSNLATGKVAVASSPTVVPPSITTQPVSQTVNAGATVTFVVVVSGTSPFTYQWQKNGTAITGATGATLTLSSVTTSSAGSYTVVVKNSAGSVTSNPATLTVLTPATAPTITTQPVSQTVTVGANVTFSVVATGTAPLSYQWRKDGNPISGATSATLTLNSVSTSDAGTYTVVVSNTAGSATSNPATLTVNNPTITVSLTSPVNGATYTTRSDVTLTASASPVSSIAKVEFLDGSTVIGTVTASPYTMTTRFSTTGTHYLRARATSTFGTTVTSAPVQITIRRSNNH